MAVAVGERWTGEELDAARRAAIAHLGYGFVPPLSEHDRENFAAEGVARTLEACAAGARIENLTQFVKTAARNAAIDDGRRHEKRNRSLEVAFSVSDGSLSPEDRLEAHSQLAAAIDALREFPAEDRALYQAKKLDGVKLGELVRATKRSRRTVSRRVRQMDAAVAAAVVELTDPQRKLLWDFANGAAHGPRRLRAQWLVRHSVDAANLVVSYKRLGEGAAAALPAPVALESAAAGSVAERLVDAPGKIRDEVLGRGADAGATSTATDQAAVLAQSGVGRAGGAASAEVLAKLGAGGAIGAKGALACIGGGAATVACVATGVVPGLPGNERRDAPKPRGVERAAAPVRLVNELPAPSAEVSEERTPPVPAKADAEPIVSRQPAPAPAPPPAEREFGLTDTAPAPGQEQVATASSTGGSGAAGSGGGEPVTQEFGP